MTGKNQLTFFINFKNKFKFEFEQNPQMKSRIFQESLRTNTSQISLRCLEQDEMRDPPQKIRQNKFTKTYSKIQYIPLQRHIETLNPKNIQHLYLSHNKIKSLSGIQQFDNLVSLNVSYNLLTKIQELQFIQKPQNILRIGLKMNDFIYGYQDYAVNFFKNLKKLDDIDINDKKKVKKLQQKGNKIANLFLQFHIRTSRLFVFLDDLIKQQKLHQKMKLKRSQKSFINPKLKLLFEHMTQDFVAKISQNYIMPSQEEFLNLCTSQILDKIQKAIKSTLEEEIDLKCTCRPRIPYQEQVKKSFQQICQNFLNKFDQRYNKQLRNGLIKINKKLNIKPQSKKFQNWELWGMLQNYSTLSLGGKCYENITSTIGKNNVQFKNQQDFSQNKKLKKKKIQQNQWRNRIFINNQNQQNDKQNYCPNILPQSNFNKNYEQKIAKQEDFKIFYDRIPIILYEKNYVQVLLQITMDIVKRILEKYDYLNKVRTTYLKNIQKQRNQQKGFFNLDQIYSITLKNNNKKIEVQNKLSQPKQKRSQKFNQLSQDRIHEQNMLKATVVQNSPSNDNDEISAKTTQRKFLKRQESQISFGINRENQFDFQAQNQKRNINKKKIDQIKGVQKEYSIYEINLIYKVLRAFKIKILKRKKKLKNQINKKKE